MTHSNFLSLFYNKRNLYILGFLIALAVTGAEVIRGRHLNFLVFADSTLYFWNGISPYTQDFIDAHIHRFFLYTPIFSVLFTPFALLPAWLGPFVWNVFNYTMFFAAIFTLPACFSHERKCRIFLFTLPILAQSLLSFQYNIPVAYLFLFAYSLLERNRGGWAVLLIMASGLTKIYGIFELALLFCYPRVWRNLGYALIAGTALFFLPLLKLPVSELVPYYGEWLNALAEHQTDQIFESIFYAHPSDGWLLPHFRMLQIGSLAVLGILFFAARRKWSTAAFRVQALAILMGWVVLFSDSAEKHTYVIALAGFALWYWSRPERTRTDRALFWSNFVLLGIMPIDLLCPVSVMRFVAGTLSLHIWVFFLTWIRMAWLTFFRPVAEFPERGAAGEAEPAPAPSVSDGTFDIVCPVYNPDPECVAHLSRSMAVLRGLYPDRRLHLIVANDGSVRHFGREEQEVLLRMIPDSEIVNIPHSGKGAAVRAGLARSDARYAVYTDIDMPYTLESMRAVIDRVLDGCDVVIAVRNASYHRRLPLTRKLMSSGSRLLNRLFLNTRFTDTQGGLKGLSARARQIMLQTRISDFLFDTEFVVLAERAEDRLRIEEVETTLRDGVVISKMSGKVLIRELKNFFRIVVRL